MQDAAWFCAFPRCDVAYFNLFGGVVLMDELKAPVYPYDPNAPICACFGLTYDDVEADVQRRHTNSHSRAAWPNRNRAKPNATNWRPTASAAWAQSKSCTCDSARKPARLTVVGDSNAADLD